MKPLITIVLVLLTTTAHAEPYLSLRGGWSHLENHELHRVEFTYDNGMIFSGALGYDFGLFRTEIEGVHARNDIDRIYSLDQTNFRNSDSRFTKTMIFLNGYVDIPLYERLELSLGGGFGFPRWQLMGGLQYRLTNHWGLSLGYRFIHEPYESRSYDPSTGLPDPRPPCCGVSSTVETLGHGPETIWENHSVMVGITYYFGE